MRDVGVGFLPVLDELGQVVGSLTERDITLRFVADALPSSTPVSAIMNSSVPTCRARDDLFAAQMIMRERHVCRLVFLADAGLPVGVLTLTDVARNEDGFLLAKTVRGATHSTRATGT